MRSVSQGYDRPLGRRRRVAGPFLRGRRPAGVVVWLLAGALLSGCSLGGNIRRSGPGVSAVVPSAIGPLEQALLLRYVAPIWNRYMAPYLARRMADALDIFEVGVGFGWGLGAQVSAGAGFVGFVRGRYTWYGVFGFGQVGRVPDGRFETRGLPVSWLDSARVLLSSARVSFMARAVMAAVLMLGWEDGIGGPRRATQGNGALAFAGFSGRRAPSSGSGAVGAAVALGPVAAIARVRIGAMLNFVTGFLGFHLFKGPMD